MSRTALGIAGLLALVAAVADAQSTKSLPYLDSQLSFEERAADLVHRMTLQEKASQLVNQARAIQRLGVPAYDWWSESLHGVARDGTTEFPEPVGLAATFDRTAIHNMAHVIGIEGRIKHAQAQAEGHSNIFEGLDFWAPNVNIFRDPRWGRGQETYGEDPYLSGRLAVSFVTGLQGDDPRYYLAIATPKHFAVHSGPESTRHFADVDVSRHDQEDTYLPAFRAAVVEGHAGSVMCAYNSANGEPACANQFLLQQTLRGAWQFQGYVVSDCGAVRDIFAGHRYRLTQAQSSAISLQRGMDNECVDFLDLVRDDHDYRPYIEAVQDGYLSEQAIDRALNRLFVARMRLGMFDPPDRVTYSKIEPNRLDSAAHRSMARHLAEESMVLLANDGVLPLRSVKRIAVVGPLAEQTGVLLGNYNGIPTHTVSVMEGLKAEFPAAQIDFVPGTQFLGTRGEPVPAGQLQTADGKPGLTAVYAAGTGIGGTETTPVLTRVESEINLSRNGVPRELQGNRAFNVRWTGVLNPTVSGDYLLGVQAQGFARLAISGQSFIQSGGTEANLRRIHLQAGQPLPIEIRYGRTPSKREPEVRLVWAQATPGPDPAALAAAKNADVVVAVVGITSRLEGEEMPVDEPGFAGGDRTNLDVPAAEEELLHAVAEAHKPLVVVLLNGSALSAQWEKAHANAILEAWYPGEEGGSAIAATLSGRNNPAGRLPVTFYQDVHQLPHFEDYSMKGRTYRYFQKEPLWPFGHGLSYTTFKYSGLTLPTAPVDDHLTVRVTVANVGKVAGDEVAQLYLKFPDIAGAPLRALRGFERIHLEPGASQEVEFQLHDRDLSMVTDEGQIIVARGKYSLSVGGGQPDTRAPSVSGQFQVSRQLTLPE